MRCVPCAASPCVACAALRRSFFVVWFIESFSTKLSPHKTSTTSDQSNNNSVTSATTIEMTQTQTQANRSRLLQEIENNDKEIAERDAAATKILQEVTAIGDMMRELDHLAKLQAPMLGIFLSLISPLPLASLLLLRRTFSLWENTQGPTPKS